MHPCRRFQPRAHAPARVDAAQRGSVNSESATRIREIARQCLPVARDEDAPRFPKKLLSFRQDEFTVQHGRKTLGRGAPDPASLRASPGPGHEAKGTARRKTTRFPGTFYANSSGLPRQTLRRQHFPLTHSTHSGRPPPTRAPEIQVALSILKCTQTTHAHALFLAHARTKHSHARTVFQSAVEASPPARFPIATALETGA